MELHNPGAIFCEAECPHAAIRAGTRQTSSESTALYHLR